MKLRMRFMAIVAMGAAMTLLLLLSDEPLQPPLTMKSGADRAPDPVALREIEDATEPAQPDTAGLAPLERDQIQFTRPGPVELSERSALTDDVVRELAFEVIQQGLSEGYAPLPRAHSPVFIFDIGLGTDLEVLLPRFLVAFSASEISLTQPVVLSYAALRGAKVPATGIALVLSRDILLGAFVSDASGKTCAWVAQDELHLVVDPFGQHPVMSLRHSGWTTARAEELSNTHGNVSDWRHVPVTGTGFYRNWKSQPHLSLVPERDGVIFRYEGGERYMQRRQPGRGNSAHHWNLLAYDLQRQAALYSDSTGHCLADIENLRFPKEWVNEYGDYFSDDWVSSALSNSMGELDQ